MIAFRARWFLAAALACAAGCGDGAPQGPKGHVIEIDIDDHGLAGLWMANAPNLKGLIARGTLAFSRVDVPTHSNQNNLTLLTGQYPEGHNAPANGWLSRTAGFASPVNLPGLTVGDYALWEKNPLRTRGDSVYHAVKAAGGRTAYVGELPPFEVGADDVRLTIVGTDFGGITVDATTAPLLLTNVLHYPADVAGGYKMTGPPDPGETQLHFTLRDAAAYVRTAKTVPAYMFVWDFIALDGANAAAPGTDSAEVAAIIEDYDAGLGELLAALTDRKLVDDTNILFTLDHGKVDTHKQVALGTHGASGTTAADGQLGALITAQGAASGLDTSSYAILNEDGDAQIYARTAGAGTPEGAVAQTDVTHKLVSLIQSGALMGVDITRTMTADGYLGTRRFHDFRANSPNQADIVVFPQDDWTLNGVDGSGVPGPFLGGAYARHGGFSPDELYVPLIMAGPAFKRGVLLPHPVEHADVAPTALAAFGDPKLALTTAARGAIHAALVDDPGETIPLPSPPDSARDLVLRGSGFGSPPPAPANPPQQVVVIVAGSLYDDEIFADSKTAAAAAPLRDLASRGTRFEDFWTRSRHWPITWHQLFSGGYPDVSFASAPEDDPTQTFEPGAGLLAMPPPPGFVANQYGLAFWGTSMQFPGETLVDTARALGVTTARVGDDVDLGHIIGFDIWITSQPDFASDPAGTVAGLAASNPRLLAVVAIGAARTSDRHDSRAIDELGTLSQQIADIAARLPTALVIVTSPGGTSLFTDMPDFYGPGSSRHAPLILVGPGVRAGIVSGQPAVPADLPATILYALGAPTSTDFALGTWATGTPVGGVPQPSPNSATEGHALLRAFSAATQ